MNWLQNSTLISIAIGIFALGSCKKGDEISSEIRPRETDLSANYDSSFTLLTKVVNFDSIKTNASYRLLVGRHQDPLFGTVTANAYLRFVNGSLRNTFGPNPEADSCYLRFTIGTSTFAPYLYGSNKKVKFRVYRNTSAINGDTITYFRKDALNYDANNLLAEVELDASLYNDTIPSTYVYWPIKNPKTFAQQFIDNQSEFSSVDSFQVYFKGLALISDESNESVIGIYDAQLVLLYHNYYGLNNLYSAEYEVISASFYNNPYAAQNQFLLDRSTGKLGSLGENLYDEVSTTELNNRCFIQSNTGTFTKVQFPSIDSFKEAAKIRFQSTKILVNKAELVIKPDFTDSANYLLPLQLYAFQLKDDGKMVKRTSNGNFQFLQDELAGIFGSQYPLYSSYYPDLGEYRFTVTTYIQAILDGSMPNTGLLLGAANALSGSSSFGSLNRVSFYNDPEKYKNKGVSSKIELRVYYTPYK